MPRNPPGLALSKLNGGVNSFEPQASADQAVEALDVIEDDGYVRRRDAFKAIGTGAPFYLPAGRTRIVTQVVSGGAYTNEYDRVFSVTATNVGGTNGHIFVGCDELFDGIDWKHVTTTPTSVTAHRYLKPKYWNGSSWIDLPSVLDTTRKRFTNGSNIWYQTLCQDGRISWHSSQLTGWTANQVNSITSYWIRLDVIDPTTSTAVGPGALTGTGSLALSAPGPRAFKLEPVTSIFPVRFKNGLQAVLLGNDRRTKRGSELGAQLGIFKSHVVETEIAHLIEDEGSGVLGQITWPHSWRAAAGQGWPSGSWNDLGAPATTTYGTTGRVLTKNDARYEWLSDSNRINDQHRGAVLVSDLAPTGSITQSSTTLSGSFAFLATNSPGTFDWEHCRLRVTTSGGGPAVGEEKEITSNTASSVSYHGHFSSAPTTSTRFDIVRPHSRLYFRESARDDGFEILQNAASTATIVPTTEYFHTNIDISNASVHWEIGREFQWKIAAGEFWTGCFDIITRKLIITNGPSGLLEFDGVSVRQLEAESDPDNARVQQWTGSLPDAAREQLSTRALAGGSLYASPPKGQFVTDYHGRLVVADGYRVRWSAPAPDNDIWPFIYETQVMDSENSPITGMATLNDSLVVWTSTSIHAAGPADDNGFFYLQPVAQGIGFVCHRAVDKIAVGGSSALIGPASDGVYVWNGSEPTAVLDDWTRLLPGGVNTRLLRKSVGAVSKHKNEYYLAVASAGSEVLDRILVYNYARQKWWVWSFPWGGCTDIARDYDEFGQERMLFGTIDGHIATLVKAKTDDGDTITGYAKSPPVSPMGSMTVAPVGLMVTMKETGGVETVTVKSFMNGEEAASQSFSDTFDAGASAFNETSQKYGPVSGVNVQATYASGASVTRKVNLPRATRGESYQFEIRGTGQWRFEGAELLLSPKSYRSK